MTLSELSDKITETQVEDSKLYFITRILKEGVKRSSKLMDKYIFKVYQVDIDDTIRQYLYDSTNEQILDVIKKDFEIIEYDVIADDSGHLFTYSISNKALSFADVVTNQLSALPPKIQSIEGIVSDYEELWAYCIGFNNIEKHDWIYTFRKIQKSKYAIDEKETTNIKDRIIRTIFSTKSLKLELLEGDAISLDKQIDCVYYNEVFYIVNKSCFEQIVGLQEEFKEQAKQVVVEMRDSEMIEGLEKIEGKIESHPAIHKKLVKIARLGNHKNITDKDVSKMKKVGSKYGINLNVKDGKLCIENEDDIDNLIKLFADYYKTGDVSGKPYGTFSGRELKANL